jgi:hypothetical protein
VIDLAIINFHEHGDKTFGATAVPGGIQIVEKEHASDRVRWNVTHFVALTGDGQMSLSK